jgi:hypothetical protein
VKLLDHDNFDARVTTKSATFNKAMLYQRCWGVKVGFGVLEAEIGLRRIHYFVLFASSCFVSGDQETILVWL